MSAATYEQDERKPSHPVMLTIYRACFLAVLIIVALGSMQYTGHMPGEFKFSYTLSNMGFDERDSQKQVADAKKAEAMQRDAEKLVQRNIASATTGKQTVQK